MTATDNVDQPGTPEAGPSEPVLVERRAGRLSIVLNRPEVANALTGAQRDRLVALLNSASRDPQVRVVTIGATGRHFCAGMDLRGTPPPEESEPVTREHYPGLTMHAMVDAQTLISAVLDCMKPVVAIVQGPAAGIGLYLALASDLIVASTQAVFVEAFAARAMVLHCGGAHLLVARLGMHRAKELVLCAGRFDAREAYQLGLINRLVEPGELDGAVDALVSQLADGPTTALGLSKRLLNQAVGADRTTAFFDEALAMEVNAATRDAGEGGLAFRERRPPKFTGR